MVKFKESLREIFPTRKSVLMPTNWHIYSPASEYLRELKNRVLELSDCVSKSVLLSLVHLYVTSRSRISVPITSQVRE